MKFGVVVLLLFLSVLAADQDLTPEPDAVNSAELQRQAEVQRQVDEKWAARARKAAERVNALNQKSRNVSTKLAPEELCELMLESAYQSFRPVRNDMRYDGFETGNVYEFDLLNPQLTKGLENRTTQVAALYEVGKDHCDGLIVNRLQPSWVAGTLENKQPVLTVVSTDCVFHFSLSDPLSGRAVPR
jgi:hypothetical protein